MNPLPTDPDEYMKRPGVQEAAEDFMDEEPVALLPCPFNCNKLGVCPDLRRCPIHWPRIAGPRT